MSSELVVRSETANTEWTQDRIDLVKRMYAREATDDEFAVFLSQCQRTGLDPAARQIYFIKRGGKPSIEPSIDGFRLIAHRTGEMDGTDGPYWCGEDGVWRDVWLDGRPPAAAKFSVYRRGCAHPFTAVVLFREFAAQAANAMWQKMPSNQLAKCCEAAALRRAFPHDLSGLYAGEDMEQADTAPAPRALPAAPAPRALPANGNGPDSKPAAEDNVCHSCGKPVGENVMAACASRGVPTTCRACVEKGVLLGGQVHPARQPAEQRREAIKTAAPAVHASADAQRTAEEATLCEDCGKVWLTPDYVVQCRANGERMLCSACYDANASALEEPEPVAAPVLK